MAAPARKVAQKLPQWQAALQRWAYNKSYFPSLGLMRDDVRFESPEVQEAVKRLPKELFEQRVFRLVRAAHLSNRKTILPKDEWMTLEKDVPYLEPYLQEIREEKMEMKEWNTIR